MKDQLALIFCFCFGVFAILAYFFPVLDELNKDYVINWTLIIFGFSMALGIISLVKSHVTKIMRRSQGYSYNVVALIGFSVMVFFGFSDGIFNLFPDTFFATQRVYMGTEEDSFFQYLFFTLQVPVQGTMFSLLAFFIGLQLFVLFEREH